MYFDSSQIIQNLGAIITQNNQIIACLWVTLAVMVCALVLNLFRSVKK